MAEKAAPASVLRGTPTYHQSWSRRLSSSNRSQNATLARAQAKRSRGRRRGEVPRRRRTAPSRARTIPHQATGNRARSTVPEKREPASAATTRAIPATRRAIAGSLAYPRRRGREQQRQTKAPGPEGPGAPGEKT